MESLTIVCRYTGIKAQIDLPKIGNLTLEYTHPLANVNTALDACQTRQFMKRLDESVLAGILITLLRNKKLLGPHKDHAAAINAQLSKASKAYLLKAVEVVRFHIMPLESTGFLPKVKFDYYESKHEASQALKSAIGTIVKELYSGEDIEAEVNRYFGTDSVYVTFQGFKKEEVLEKARFANAVKAAAEERRREDLYAEAARRAKAREAKYNQSSKTRELKADIRTVSQRVSKLDNITLTEKQIKTIAQYAQQGSLAPVETLEKLVARIEALYSEADDKPTMSYLESAIRVFKHYLKEAKNDNILDALETVHEPQAAPSKEEPQAKKSSLLERIRAKAKAGDK